MATGTITKTTLAAILSSTKETSITVTYRSKVKVPKSSDLYGMDCEKETTSTYLFGSKSYSDRVNTGLENSGKDGDFKSSKLPFGHWYAGAVNRIIETDSGDLYIRCYDDSDSPRSPRTFYLDGVPATSNQTEEIKDFLPKDYDSAKQKEAGLEGASQVRTRTLKFDNIQRIEIGSNKYTVR